MMSATSSASNESRGEPLNHYRLSQLLGSYAVPGPRQRFGGLSLGAKAKDFVAARLESMPQVEFSSTDDQVIAKAFTAIHEGRSVDRCLSDPVWTERFESLCRQLGLTYEPAVINRRLLAIRKAAGGGLLPKTTRREVQSGLFETVGPAVEIAITATKVRFAASIDDILADRRVGEYFDRIAKTIAVGSSSIEVRTCALQIRKSRFVPKKQWELFDSIGLENYLELLSHAGTLDSIDSSRSGRSPGLIFVSEPRKPLYIWRQSDLESGLGQLGQLRVLDGISKLSRFWNPRPSDVGVYTLEMPDDSDVSLHQFELGAVFALRPTFNLPVRFGRPAA